jgi:hypothetical protein
MFTVKVSVAKQVCVIYIECQTSDLHTEMMLMEDAGRETLRQAEVEGLIARTKWEWGLLFTTALLVYGVVGAWLPTWLEPLSVHIYLLAVLVLVVAAALTASAFRGSRYYNRHYEMIWNHYYTEGNGV